MALLSASTCPATHVVHVVAPQPAYVPLLHAMQGVDELESVSAWPAVQKLHPLDPLAAYWPTAQASHTTTLVPPAVGAKNPAEHSRHGPA